MKKIISYTIASVCELLLLGLYFYFALPAINPTSFEFWGFIFFALISSSILFAVAYLSNTTIVYRRGQVQTVNEMPKFLVVTIGLFALIFVVIFIIDFICSPLFNASSYAKRITIDETGEFVRDIAEVNFQMLPLLDRDSSEKLGDRVMGQMSELVSQYYVSDQYTQINYNNDIIRVTPLEYADIIKWFSNRQEGVKGYITVNSVSGEANLIKLDKGMKYMPSAHFNEKLVRKLRFTYPTTIFGSAKFEIDNDGNPYWIVPTYSYTGVNLKTKVTGVIILDPITGDSEKYAIKDVPTWVDNAYNADLLIEQVDNWGEYRGGFFNSLFGQKNVVNTTEGYNYLAMNDDIYLYTGITSVLADESNLGFILSNMRTGKTIFYSVPGAEEYSAMASAEGQVQQMKYVSTFPLLINLNGKATYLVSLKDAAGLVKMYGFIDVQDYQKVVVTDAAMGIEAAAQNYLNNYADDISEDLIQQKEITIRRITSAILNGNTYYYLTDSEGKRYKIALTLSDELPFLNSGDKITVGYYNADSKIIEVIKFTK